MADMSPEAVTKRLRLMDELWELSVALMNAKHATNAVPPLKKGQTERGERDGDTMRGAHEHILKTE